MPTTGIFNGTNLVVLVGTEVVAHSTSCSLSVSADHVRAMLSIHEEIVHVSVEINSTALTVPRETLASS